VFFRGEVMGALEVVNRRSGPFSGDDLRALSALALQVGIALNHTRAAVSLRATALAARQRTQDLESEVAERTVVLERAKKEWEQTFDAISEPVAVLDGFVVRRANKSYARRARLPITHVTGRTCYQLVGRSEPCAGCPLIARRRTGAAELEVVEGRRHTVATYAISDGGTVVHYRDVTESRALEVKLRDTDRLAAVGQLAAGAAHEINNPLGFVSSNLSSLDGFFEDLAGLAGRLALAAQLAGTGKGKEAVAMLARMHAQGEQTDIAAVVEDASGLIAESQAGLRRVADIVRALKELAKQELQGNSEPVSLATALELALRALGPEYPGVKARMGARDEGLVRGQPLQLQQALQAVLKNALQAAQAGGGVVDLSTDLLGAEVRLTIADDGPGIDPAIRARVFEPFFTTRGIGGGVGLGLTAAYGIITRHGGRIELGPRAGGGTVATLCLPSAVAARPTTEGVPMYRAKAS
jgi:signal transduction histidine kinase